MKEILQRLFTPEQPRQTAATVVCRVALGRYEVRDDAGRVHTVDSSLIWTPGTRVVIQSGRIVAASGAAQTIKSYEV